MHWHGYSYIGSGEAVGSFDRANRSPDGAAFASSNIPPFFTSHWLRRPASAIARTFNDAEAAVDWAGEAFQAAHRSPERQPWPSVSDRRAGSIEQLAMGNDILYSAWVNTTTLAEYYVISCPPAGGSARCPLGHKDTRPAGSTVITAIP